MAYKEKEQTPNPLTPPTPDSPPERGNRFQFFQLDLTVFASVFPKSCLCELSLLIHLQTSGNLLISFLPLKHQPRSLCSLIAIYGCQAPSYPGFSLPYHCGGALDYLNGDGVPVSSSLFYSLLLVENIFRCFSGQAGHLALMEKSIFHHHC